MSLAQVLRGDWLVDRNGSAYTFIFATIVTTVAAILLGSAATALKPLQDLNADVDKNLKYSLLLVFMKTI